VKAVFVDTHSLYRAQQGELDIATLRPIVVYDLDDDTADRTADVDIVGPARLRFDMSPSHNLARVWIEADPEPLDYDGEPVNWSGARTDRAADIALRNKIDQL
jgi:hypothetical protein